MVRIVQELCNYAKAAGWIFAVSFLAGFLACPTHGQVTFDHLANSDKEPSNWLTYSGDYSGKRFSSLDRVQLRAAALQPPIAV